MGKGPLVMSEVVMKAEVSTREQETVKMKYYIGIMAFSPRFILLRAVCSTPEHISSKVVSGFATHSQGNRRCHYRSNQTMKIYEELPVVPEKSGM